jgi:hypothetical protein
MDNRQIPATTGRSDCVTNAFSTSALGPETLLLNCLIEGGAYGRLIDDLGRLDGLAEKGAYSTYTHHYDGEIRGVSDFFASCNTI